jgi:hypothetical protein
MTLTKSQRHNRRNRAKRKMKREQYLIDRMKEQQFPLAECLANELGDIEAGTPITMREFQRCLYRIADIRAGRVKRPTRNEKLERLGTDSLGVAA